MKLTVIGLGVKDGDLSLSAYRSIIDSPLVILRTAKTPSSGFLGQVRTRCVSLDSVYEKSRSFDTLTKNLVKEVEKYLKESDVCYLVDGAVSEDNSAQLLLSKHKDATVFEGVSKSSAALISCGVKSNDYQSISAYDFAAALDFSYPLAIYDVDNVGLACEIKLKIADLIGDEAVVYFCQGGNKKKIFVYEIDRQDSFDYSTVIVIDQNQPYNKLRYNFNDLYKIINRLRAKDGCPWDKVQTKESIRKNLIEECYELVDAIDKDDDEKIAEEIGDVLLQAVFHTVFLEENGSYTLNDVLSGVCNKLIFRHSHVFGNDKAYDENNELDIWDKNKQIEKGFDHKAYVADVPKCFPSLLRAQKTIKRIRKYSSLVPSGEKMHEILCDLVEKKNYTQALLAICYIMNAADIDCEEKLYFEIDRLCEAYLKADNDSFDVEKYFLELKNAD